MQTSQNTPQPYFSTLRVGKISINSQEMNFDRKTHTITQLTHRPPDRKEPVRSQHIDDKLTQNLTIIPYFKQSENQTKST